MAKPTYKFNIGQHVQIHGVTWQADDVTEGSLVDNGRIGTVTQRRNRGFGNSYGVRVGHSLYEWYSERNLRAVLHTTIPELQYLDVCLRHLIAGRELEPPPAYMGIDNKYHIDTVGNMALWLYDKVTASNVALLAMRYRRAADVMQQEADLYMDFMVHDVNYRLGNNTQYPSGWDYPELPELMNDRIADFDAWVAANN